MAGPTVKEILLKWGIDNTNWKKAILELSALLEKQNKASEKAADKAAAQLEAQKQKLKDYITDQKSATAEIEKQISKLQQKVAAAKATKAEAEAKLAVDKATVAEINKQVSSEKQVLAAHKTVQSELAAQIAQQKLITAQVNAQTAAIRQQAAAYRFQQQQQRPVGGGGGHHGGGGVGGFLSGLFGGGLFGNVAAAVASAEALGEAVKELGEKINELMKEVGPLQQVKEQFEKLAPSRGIDDPVEFIKKLRDATHGLVTDISLYREANTFLQSSVRASNEQIVQLTQATVGLARAQGRDATSAMQALQRFFLTGRAQTLAYATGIQRVNLMVGGLGRGTDATITSQKQFQQALEAITEQYRMIGEPALTYAEALKQVSVSVHNLIEEFMLGVTQSQGFKSFIVWLGQMAEKIQGMAERAASFGNDFGNAFTVVVEAAKTLLDALTDIYNIQKTIFESIGKIFLPDTISSEFIQRLTTVKGLLVTMSQILIILRGAMNEFALRTEYTMKEAAVSAKEAWKWLNTPVGKGGYDNARVQAEQARLHQEFLSKLNPMQSEEYKQLLEMQKQLTGLGEGDYRIKFAAPSNIFTQEQEEAAARKVAKVKEQIAVESSKVQLSITELRIKNEQELLTAQYEQGLMTQKDYLEKKGALDLQDHNARLAQIKQEFDAKEVYNEIEARETRAMAAAKKADVNERAEEQLASIAKQRTEIGIALDKAVQDKTITAPDAASKKAALEKQYDTLTGLIERSRKAGLAAAGAETAELDAKDILTAQQKNEALIKEDQKYFEVQRANREKERSDEISARKSLVDLEKKLDEDAVARKKQILEKQFQEGMISSNEYLQQQVDLANRDYQVAADAAQKKLEQNKDSLVAQATFDKEMAEAAMKRQQDLTALTNREWDLRVQAAQSAANRIKNILEGQLQYGQEQEKLNPFTGKGTQVSALTGLISLEKQRLEIQQEQLKAMTAAGLAGSETWSRVYAEVAKTQQQMVQYNAELIKARDYSSALAGAAKDLSTAASLFPKGGKTSEGFSRFAQVTETISGLMQRYREQQLGRNAPAAPKTPQEVYTALQNEGQKASKILQQALQDSATEVKKWTDTSKQAQADLTKSINDLTEALKRATQAMDTELSGGASSGPSGPAVPGSSSATVTSSDLQDLAQTASSSIGGSLQGPAQAAVGLGAVAQQSNLLVRSFQSLTASLSSGGTGGLAGMLGDLSEHLTDIWQGLKSKDASQFGGGIQGLLGMGTAVAGGVGGIVSAAKGKGGPFQSGMTGAASGFQLGMMFGGPLGGLIGGGAGLITGIFSGKAEQQAEKLAKKIVAMFNAVQTEIQNGTQTLAAGIQLQIKNIENAVSQLSGKKGGRDQLKNILPQMEQQLAQLQSQQQSIIKTFDQQLDVLNLPVAFQDTASQVQQIIQTYQQYIQAGGSVVNANQYLQDSFKKLSQDGFSQLNQDEQDAIQNALNYNDLLIQRQNLIEDTNQQIQDIMSQGVAVRQMPAGVSKARQIQELMLQSSNQMDQLNEEISVSQHKLNVEQQIFGLATTRVGLESQLVTLQNQQTDLDMQRIVALQQTVGDFQSALPTSMQAFMGQLGFGAGYVSPSTEPGLVPTPPVKTGIPDIDLQNQLEYQQALAAYQLSLNMPVGYIPPSGTVTSTPVPVSIGNLTASTTTSLPSNSTWLTPGSTSIVGTAAMAGQAATSFTDTLVQLPGKIASAIGGQSLTVNSQQIDTLSTAQGTALLVVPTSPGTSQLVGVPNLGNPTTSSVFSSLTGVATTLPPASPILDASTQRLQVESQISQLSSTRMSSEAQLVNLKMVEISSDMARVQAHNLLLDRYQSMQGGVSPSSTLEDLMQQVYETRGRQGFGKFYGELANPT